VKLGMHAIGTKIILFGASTGGLHAVKYYKTRPSYEIVAVVDSDLAKQGNYLLGFKIEPPEVITSTNYDLIIICTSATYEVRYKLTERFSVLQSAIRDLDSDVLVYGPPSVPIILLRYILRATNLLTSRLIFLNQSIRGMLREGLLRLLTER
jgi:hypothetical protein